MEQSQIKVLDNYYVSNIDDFRYKVYRLKEDKLPLDNYIENVLILFEFYISREVKKIIKYPINQELYYWLEMTKKSFDLILIEAFQINLDGFVILNIEQQEDIMRRKLYNLNIDFLYSKEDIMRKMINKGE